MFGRLVVVGRVAFVLFIVVSVEDGWGEDGGGLGEMKISAVGVRRKRVENSRRNGRVLRLIKILRPCLKPSFIPAHKIIGPM